MTTHYYFGARFPDGSVDQSAWSFVQPSGPERLNMRFDLYDASPDGGEWGYPGSGPAQLSLAILAHATGDDDYAVTNLQRFKNEVIADIPHDARIFKLDREEVWKWVAARIEKRYYTHYRVPRGWTCRECVREQHYPDADCPRCHGTGTDPVPLADRCRYCFEAILEDETTFEIDGVTYDERCARRQHLAMMTDPPDREVWEDR